MDKTVRTRSAGGMSRMGQAILAAAVAILMLTIMDGLMKDLVTRIGAVQLTFLRFVTTTLISGAAFLALRTPLPGRSAVTANLVRGIFIAASALTFFYGLGQLPLAEVFAISYIGPILVALLAIPFLGERPSGRIFFGLAVGFAGVIVTVGIGSGVAADAGRLAGAAAILFSAATYAGAVLLLRRQAQRDPMMTVVLFQSAVPALLLALPALLTWGPVAAYDWFLLFIVGGLGFAGHVLFVFAFARGEASRLAAVEYTGFVWAALIGFLAFAEVPTLPTVAGAALIIAACFIIRR